MPDIQYQNLPLPGPGLTHAYGDKVRILSHPYAMSLLERLCSPTVVQPTVNRLVRQLYDCLLADVASTMLARKVVTSPTRMESITPHGVYIGECIDPDQRVVVVDVARAGIVPADQFYDGLHGILRADSIRQDHVVASRVTDANGAVTGVTLDGSKIGGDIADATVLFPDPMGATGTSLAGVIDHYSKICNGRARAMVAVHLIVTPEYLARMTAEFPNLFIFAIRLDRGLSTERTLAAVPGAQWDEEVGLTDQQYIVPGAGGVGELLNNAWI
ncbi:MAG: uracil phosphoribosyltransferase [Myxococcota bacterium]|nr:uracil phosphoribosyltransferase [Myxococcota bacterium]